MAGMTRSEGDSRVRARSRGGRFAWAVAGVVGEVLITTGVFVFLFLGWQLWLNDIIQGNAQRDEALALSQSFAGEAAGEAPGEAPAVSPQPQPPDPSATPSPSSGPSTGGFGDPVVSSASSVNTRFATIYVPRFGDDYVRTIAEGVSAGTVLKTNIGHYPGTQMPGEVGNFALAGHRTTYGAPFNRIADLQVGDEIIIQTADGWYTYVFRSLEYVLPTGVGVLDEVPQNAALAPTERVMTMTSCNPLLSAAERIIAYSVFESWQPTSAGPPDAVTSLVEQQA